jgi:hypothetical protein
MNRCTNHPDREGRWRCVKNDVYFCDECMKCSNPRVHCRHRTSCVIWEIVRHGDQEEERTEKGA